MNHERILLLVLFMRFAFVKLNPDCSIKSLCKSGDNICVANCDSDDCLGEYCQGFRGCHRKCLPGSHSLNFGCKKTKLNKPAVVVLLVMVLKFIVIVMFFNSCLIF